MNKSSIFFCTLLLFLTTITFSQSFPDFTETSMAGDTFDSKKLRAHGKHILITYWRTD